METIKNIYHRDIGPKLYIRHEKKVARERLPLNEWFGLTFLINKPMDVIDASNVVRKALLTESIHDGHKNNQEKSAKDIPGFVKFFEIDMSQFKRENLEDYHTFDDFFTREVKEGQRPIAEPNDDSVVVSPADCRMIVFDSLDEARDIMIKGEKFSYEKLLGHDKDLADTLLNGCIANFRLCPQDYHRFHTPVSGTIRRIRKLGGTTYSVEPKAMRSDIDVLGDNEREVIEIDTEEYGKVAYVAIGARQVGLVKSLVKEGERVKKGDEIGYFHYGGSDIVVMFEKKVNWDEDLREYSKQGMETLVKTNERVGKYFGKEEEQGILNMEENTMSGV